MGALRGSAAVWRALAAAALAVAAETGGTEVQRTPLEVHWLCLEPVGDDTHDEAVRVVAGDPTLSQAWCQRLGNASFHSEILGAIAAAADRRGVAAADAAGVRTLSDCRAAAAAHTCEIGHPLGLINVTPDIHNALARCAMDTVLCPAFSTLHLEVVGWGWTKPDVKALERPVSAAPTTLPPVPPEFTPPWPATLPETATAEPSLTMPPRAQFGMHEFLTIMVILGIFVVVMCGVWFAIWWRRRGESQTEGLLTPERRRSSVSGTSNPYEVPGGYQAAAPTPLLAVDCIPTAATPTPRRPQYSFPADYQFPPGDAYLTPPALKAKGKRGAGDGGSGGSTRSMPTPTSGGAGGAAAAARSGLGSFAGSEGDDGGSSLDRTNPQLCGTVASMTPNLAHEDPAEAAMDLVRDAVRRSQQHIRARRLSGTSAVSPGNGSVRGSPADYLDAFNGCGALYTSLSVPNVATPISQAQQSHSGLGWRRVASCSTEDPQGASSHGITPSSLLSRSPSPDAGRSSLQNSGLGFAPPPHPGYRSSRPSPITTSWEGPTPGVGSPSPEAGAMRARHASVTWVGEAGCEEPTPTPTPTSASASRGRIRSILKNSPAAGDVVTPTATGQLRTKLSVSGCRLPPRPPSTVTSPRRGARLNDGRTPSSAKTQGHAPAGVAQS